MNRKIKNATQCGEFKSKSELMVYNTLKEEGFNPKYEETTYTLWKGFKPSVPFWTKNNKNVLAINKSAVRDITYTPDFSFVYKGYQVIIEVKGFPNDVFPYKFKMFRKKIEEASGNYIIALIHNNKQLKEFIVALRELEPVRLNEKTIAI